MSLTALARLLRAGRCRPFAQTGLLIALCAAAVQGAEAQVAPTDTTKSRRDTAAKIGQKPAPATAAPVTARGRFTPHITPRPPVNVSALLPGTGQTHLCTCSARALFSACCS